MKRDGVSREEAEQRIQSQMPQEEKLKFADFSIDTSERFEETRMQIEGVFRKLQELAKEPQR
jgi:dephospho-CoA kinase